MNVYAELGQLIGDAGNQGYSPFKRASLFPILQFEST